MKDVSKCNDLYEQSANFERNKKEQGLKTKFLDCVNFIVCWRSNKRFDNKVLNVGEKQQILKSQ